MHFSAFPEGINKMKMIKIMFVCHGNICRSPMAEIIMRDMIEKRGLSDKISVASSATSTEEIGNPVYPPARRELAKHSLSAEGKFSVQLTRSDYEKYDYFVGMDSRNILNMHRILDGDPDNKILKLLDLTDKGGDVADPWYTGEFSQTYSDCLLGCEALLRLILQKPEI